MAAGLLAWLGLSDGAPPQSIPKFMPKVLHRAIARLLHPAESATRRLILVLARAVAAKPPPPVSARRPPAGLAGAARGKSRAAFRLFDARQRFAPLLAPLPAPGREPADGGALAPRIHVFEEGGVRTVSLQREPPPTKPDISPARLARRLLALQDALGDLPRQARRMARALARRATVPRLRFRGPLRPGHPPGYRRRISHEVDGLLHECDWLARQALPPDTS